MPIAYNSQTNEALMLTPDGQWAPTKIAQNPQTGERMAFDGRQWQGIGKPTAQPLSMRERLVGGLDSAMQGATFGLSDELRGGLNVLTGRGTYQQGVDEERGNIARFRQDSPKTAAAAEFAGAMLPSVAAAPLGVGATVLGTMGRGAALGAAEGAAYGAGTGGDAQDRLTRGALGAAGGGLLGAAVPGAIETGKMLYRGARAVLTPEAAASADIRRAVARDQMTPGDLAQRSRQLSYDRPGPVTGVRTVQTPTGPATITSHGPSPTTLADAGGENLQGVVERIANTPGAGRSVVIPALTQRQQGQLARVGYDLRNLTGASRSATQAVNDTMQQRAKDAAPLYQEAYFAQLDPAAHMAVEDAFRQALATPLGRSAWSRAQRMLQSTPEFRNTPAGSIPLTAQVDYWHRALADQAGSALGQSNLKRSLVSLSKSVTDPLKDANPAWRAALDAWSTPSAFIDAVDAGRAVLSPATSAEEWAATLHGMTPNEVEGARIGALSAIQGKMQNDAANLPDLTKYLRSPAMRAKVAALMPDPVSADRWQRALDAEIGMADLTRRATGNSRTAVRQAEQGDMASGLGEAAMALVHTSPLAALLRLPVAAARRVVDTARSRTDAATARVLLNPNVPAAFSRVQGPPPIGYGRPGMAGSALVSPVVAALAGQGPSQ